MRAWYPDRERYIERDGIHVFCDILGEGEPTVLLLPISSIIRSRFHRLNRYGARALPARPHALPS